LCGINKQGIDIEEDNTNGIETAAHIFSLYLCSSVCHKRM